MEDRKRGSEIFLGVIGIATLVVAMIGATFAFFSANASSAENAVTAGAATLSLDFTDATNTNLKTHLIPAADHIAKYAALVQTGTGDGKNKQCTDDNGNEVCGVYEFTVTNPSTTTTQDISVSLEVNVNEFANLTYEVYEGTASALNASSTPTVAATKFLVPSTQTPKPTTTLALGPSGSNTVQLGTTSADNSKTYTIVIWIHEIKDDENAANGGDQTAVDSAITEGQTTRGRLFAATVKVSTGNGGTGVTGVITSAGSGN